MNDFNLDFPISFVKKEQRIVVGIATADNIDKTGDIVDFEASLEAFKDWAGNIREMHSPKAVGKAISYEPVKITGDDGKEYNAIKVEAYISKGAQDTWEKVLDGTLRSFSIGGAIIEKSMDKTRLFRGRPINIIKKYRLGELSLVDNPANALAAVDIIKRNPDGILEYVLEEFLNMTKKQPLKDPKGGLTAAGRRHFKQTEGANLKPGVKGPADTPEKMRRKGSFLTRFFTNPSGPMKDEKGRPTRLALSAAAWGEPVPQNAQDAAALAAKGRRLLERYAKTKEKSIDDLLEEDADLLSKEMEYFESVDLESLINDIQLNEENLEEILKSLTQWFKEDWVDISRPKKGGGFEPCGRSDANKGKYPKCVPASKAARMSQEEIDSAIRRKRRAESTTQRDGKKPINVSTYTEKAEQVNIPTNPELYSRVKSEAKQKFRVYPSAYANAWIVREYKKRGGGYRMAKEGEVTTGTMGAGIMNPTQGYPTRNRKRKNKKEIRMKKEINGQSTLIDVLNDALSNSVVLYFSAHRAHWNVEGPDFFEYHSLFEEIYEDVYGSTDPFAENVRKLGGFPPTIGEMEDMAAFEDSSDSSDAKMLATDLYIKNEAIVEILKNAFTAATDANEQGIANFIAERIDMHEKWCWQLKSSLMAHGVDIPVVTEQEEDAAETGDGMDNPSSESSASDLMDMLHSILGNSVDKFVKAAPTKRENGEDFPAAAFAYVPDPSMPSTWKLRLWETASSKETPAQVGRAVAAIGAGFRGNKVEIPSGDMAKVKGKIISAWRKTHPGAKTDEMPDVLKFEDGDTPSFIKMQGELLQNHVQYDTVDIMNEQELRKSFAKRMLNWLIPDVQDVQEIASTSVEVSETTQEEEIMDIEILKDALSAVVDEKLAVFATSIKEEVEAAVQDKIDNLTKGFDAQATELQEKLQAAEKSLAEQEEQVKAFGKAGAIKKSVDPEDDDEDEQIVKSQPASVWNNVYLPQGIISSLGYRS